MIEFISRKPVDYDRVHSLLMRSDAANHWTNNGPVKLLLEENLKSFCGIDTNKAVVCMSSGTAALHAIMFHCQCRHGTDKHRLRWVTPAFTFPSVSVNGEAFDVDVLDVDPETYTLPKDEGLLSVYDGIVITNPFGVALEVDWWVDFCRAFGKILVFDNAGSALSYHSGKNLHNYGAYSFGSLHHTKTVGFGEGGFAVLPEEEYDAVNRLAGFGLTPQRDYSHMSSNFKMSDVSAAFVLSHIDGYDLEAHLRTQARLAESVSRIEGLEVFGYAPGVVYGSSFPVLGTHETSLDELANDRVVVMKYYRPIEPLPNALDLYNRMINFPLHIHFSEEDIDTICDVARCFAQSEHIRNGIASGANP